MTPKKGTTSVNVPFRHSNLCDDQLSEAFYAQEHGNDSGAQTNAERSRPRALPEALEALFARSRIVGVLLKHKAEDKLYRRINCFTAVTSVDRYVYVDKCTSKLYIETSI